MKDFLSIAVLFATCIPAAPQTMNCNPRDVVIERLGSRYQEVRKSEGLSSVNTVVEVFASDQNGSWTITITTPHGMTCIVATGHHYRQVEDILPPDGDDS